MSYSIRVSRIIVGLFVTLAMPLGARETSTPEPQWIDVRSPHFSVVTDAGERRGRETALRFEQIRAVLADLLVKPKAVLPTPVQIVAFRNAEEMRQFVPLWHGQPTQIAGLFETNDDRSFIILDLSVENPQVVVFHEYAHLLLSALNTAPVPPWFAEGFADYFSTAQFNGKEVVLGLPPERSLETLQGLPWMKMSELLAVQQDSSTYYENSDRRRLFYAQSWLAVHYLFSRQLITKAFLYFDMVAQKKSIEAAVQSAFGASIDQLDLELRNHLRARPEYYRLPAPVGIDAASFSSRALPEADSKVVLADVHAHAPGYQDEASAEFEAVLKLHPGDPLALQGLGYVYLLKQQYARANDYFTRALAAAPGNSRVLYYCALLMNKVEGAALGTDRQNLALMQQRLETSIALDPDFADAYDLLAFTYTSQGDHAKAILTMRKALELRPQNEAYRFNLAQMYTANRDFEIARDLLQPLIESRDPELAGRARDSFEKLEQAGTTQQRGANLGKGNVNTPALPQSAADQNHPPAAFIQGRLVSVDCSAPPSAVLTVMANARLWRLEARYSGRVIVIGAERLSCDWSNRNVAVNFRPTGEGAGELVSIELR